MPCYTVAVNFFARNGFNAVIPNSAYVSVMKMGGRWEVVDGYRMKFPGEQTHGRRRVVAASAGSAAGGERGKDVPCVVSLM
jgi:hypothetical protein